MISLKEAIEIAKDDYGENFKLYKLCHDLGKDYAFSAVLKNGRSYTGLMLLIDKETGRKSYGQYIPLPGNKLAERMDKGKEIDISDMI